MGYSNMAAAHNMFIQGLNAMIRHGPTVNEDKVEPFMIFCLTVVCRPSLYYFPFFILCAFQLDSIHQHHTLEETVYFPALEEKLGKGALSGNIEEHGEFVPNLEALEEWCKKVQGGEIVYDGQTFLGMVEAFADTMVAHMTNVRSIYFLVVLENLPISYRNSQPWTAISFEKSLPWQNSKP